MSKHGQGKRGGSQPAVSTGDKQQLVRVETTESTTFSGPVPPPDVLSAYDKLVPGAAARLIQMAEDVAAHQRELRARRLDSDIEDRQAGRAESKRGQVFGLIIGLAAIGGGTTAAVLGAPVPGGFIGTGGIVALVAVFVWGRSPRSPEQP